nr:hypothetical protein [Tanacetum cinerariifolium]
EADAVTLLKRIRKFSMAQDIGARAAVYIFNRINFAIAKGVMALWTSQMEDHTSDWLRTISISGLDKLRTDGGLDVCVDLTGSSPLTQTGMVDFVADWIVIDVAQRKCGKYMAKCAAIGYGFLPFSFSSLEETERQMWLH